MKTINEPILYRSRLLQFYIIPVLLCFFLVISYLSLTKTIPVVYWDEALWVGRSYFFEFLINRDFTNTVWQSYESYDQPKLAEYAYGAWLYPQYLKNKNESGKKEMNYVKFLISNGFYMTTDQKFSDVYNPYYKRVQAELVVFDQTDEGSPKDYVTKYGVRALKTINLIYDARNLNSILLALAVVAAYFIFYAHTNTVFATIFSFLYGFNFLLITTSLKAHSEALYILLFNGAVLSLVVFFLRKRQVAYLLLFSLLTGLCMSTKITGALLILFFVSLSTWHYTCITKGKLLLTGLFHICVVLGLSSGMFVILNPFTYTQPLNHAIYMVKHRAITALDQSKSYPESYLPTPQSRLVAIQKHIYNPATYLFPPLSDTMWGTYYSTLLLICFWTGLILETRQAYKGNKNSMLMLLGFFSILIAMTYYLLLDWDRYYVHLLLFIVLYQGLGIMAIYTLSKKWLLKYNLIKR